MGAEDGCDGRATFASILGRREDDPRNKRDYYFMSVTLMTVEQKEKYFEDFPEMQEKYKRLVESGRRNVL